MLETGEVTSSVMKDWGNILKYSHIQVKELKGNKGGVMVNRIVFRSFISQLA